MLVTFTNVTVEIVADTPRTAHEILDEALSNIPDLTEWCSGNYQIDDGPPRDTVELFP